MEKFNKITLENGLRIIIVPKPDSLSTTVLVLVEAGSKYETKEINGISHFLEHMCFKGTKKRPRAIDIASELDSLGASYNAFTSQEYTGYYAKAQPKHFDKILDIISDMYLNPVFDQNEINKERGVIVEEINMYEDLPMRRVQQLFLNLLYGDQPAGWDIAGSKEIIKELNREDFLKYKKNHYLASSTIAVVSGKFDDEAVGKIKSFFSGIKTNKKIPKIKTKEFQENPQILLKYKESDQAHLVLGVRAYDIFDKRKYAFQVLVNILGSGMSSRLFQKIRDEMGAAYYIRAEADLFTDHGYLAVFAGVDNKRIEEVIKAILEEFRKLSQKAVDEKELQKSKDHLLGNLMLSLETSDELASFYGGQEILTKKLIGPDELAQKIQAVKAEEIMAVAKDIFQNNKLNLAIIGPFKDKNRFEKILTL
ncbi:MAG: putative zinc protease [Candidatus Wolfebacteria bacterium GW2011_GWA2_42_10]|uniref:Putative zinc protease n=2 Tax=Candidatus Wolfeibacteriota TaxID=1752735 RepID=A0A0G0ZTE6_9BACT|nr:MAG: putative zinc protease [Candidatus Wolfebacteria bacterium GW2011_GWB1_41_12]KKS25256.1 MAG: putative zinc protease [Candidatus Wolfebacteria bacterium GW2011_GWA2_42_10]KKT56696.1 MAG: putative zinc protease [Candidatus Wolfebacteria bacterium GW2011_GWA1_44_24]